MLPAVISLFLFTILTVNTSFCSDSLEEYCPLTSPCSTMSGDGAREQTFIMIKPDGVQRGLVGEIIKRFEQKGFKLVAMKFMWVSPPPKDHALYIIIQWLPIISLSQL
jgi:hypothetical protein